jgi:hypothetical protein
MSPGKVFQLFSEHINWSSVNCGSLDKKVTCADRSLSSEVKHIQKDLFRNFRAFLKIMANSFNY